MNKKPILAFLVIVITILLTIIMISNLEKENKEKIVIHSPPTPTLTSMPISTAIPTIIPTSTPIETSTPVPTAMPTPIPTPNLGKYLGEFKITGYTASPSENGGYTVTALGDNLHKSVGWAIAVDPKVIPLKSKIYIEGIGHREARDTGGAIKGNKIDVLTKSNKESHSITGYYKVYLVE